MPKLGPTGTKTDQFEFANLRVFRRFPRRRLVGVSGGIALITRRSSAWSTSCSHFADQFKSIGENQGVAFSGRCGPPQPFGDSQGRNPGFRPFFLPLLVEYSLIRNFPQPRFLGTCLPPPESVPIASVPVQGVSPCSRI